MWPQESKGSDLYRDLQRSLRISVALSQSHEQKGRKESRGISYRLEERETVKVKHNESEIEEEQMNNRVRRHANTEKEESSCGTVERENTGIKECGGSTHESKKLHRRKVCPV